MSEDHDIDGLLARAEELQDLGRAQQAVPLIARVIASRPGDATAWLLMARSQLMLDDASECLVTLGRAVALDPSEAAPHAMASSALAKLGRHEEAVAAALEAVRLEPHEPAWHHAAALALLDVPRGFERALVAVDTALHLAPDEPVLLTTRGTVLLGLGRAPEAEACLTAALAIRPDYSVALHELARVRAGRVFGPATLARSAMGYADALGAAPEQQVSRHQLDLLIRQFFSRVCFGIGLLTYVAARLGRYDAHVAIRLVAALAVIGPAVVVGRFVRGLQPSLRRYVRTVVTTGALRIATALQGLTALALLAAVVLPGAHQLTAVLIAFGTSFIARIVVALESRLFLIRLGHRQKTVYSTSLLTVVFVLAALVAVACAALVVVAPTAAAIGLAISLPLAAWTFVVIRRRRKHSRTAV